MRKTRSQKKRSVTVRKLLIHYYLSFICLVLFAAILVLTLREIIDLRKRVEKLQRTVEELQQRTESNQKPIPISKRVKDDKGNIFDTYIIDIKTVNIRFYYKGSNGDRIASLQNLRQYVESNSNELVFATNGGMYTSEGAPLGLLIIDGQEISPVNLKDGIGNFYLKPNGVFTITNDKAFIINSQMFHNLTDPHSVIFATQSGPLLVIDGEIHPKFAKDSKNKNIRSGVGIISPRKIIFAISKNKVNFIDFAILFKDHFKCRDALYLDGIVSRMYLPALKRYDSDGEFAGIIAVTNNASKYIR